MRNWIIMACAGLVLSGCNRPAGFEVDNGTFGNATLNNVQMMNGERGYAEILGERFAREVPSQVNFAFNSAQIDATAQQILTQQANWIRQFPEVRFRVYGHTDLVGSPAYNKSLGKRRAQAVVNFFAARGIDRSRLEALVSFGETQPLIQTSDRERRNRRTVTEVSGFSDKYRSTLDGKYAQVIYREYVESAVPPSALSLESTLGGSEQ
ncbi:OmpA family protein [Lutimaribacter marinistellae]|uniref:OmpA family protein n=1 Tax=Lutimaribacter marinistellae TaxID=1820329 RepID=A0ABV7TFI8_9RHOB